MGFDYFRVVPWVGDGDLHDYEAAAAIAGSSQSFVVIAAFALLSALFFCFICVCIPSTE